MNWDPKLKTAISDLEVEKPRSAGPHVALQIPARRRRDPIPMSNAMPTGNVAAGEETRDYIAIATTRPETMLGDGAVAVHPDDARYAPIVGMMCEIPVGPKEHRRLIPIITDEYPDPDFGSGAVKITGAHDENDYGVAQRNNIPMYRLMDEVAAMRSDGAPYAETAALAREIAAGRAFTAQEIDTLNLVPDEYRGLDRYEARKRVVADIDAEGLMLGVEDKVIMQPFGDRGGVVIEPMLTDQWYVNAAELAKKPIAAVQSGEIQIVPKTWEKTFFNWMNDIQPWCVSRQLWWGHRIPAWHCFNQVTLDTEIYVAATKKRVRSSSPSQANGGSNASSILTLAARLSILCRTGLYRSTPVLFIRTKTCSTRGSPPPCGLLPRWGGRRTGRRSCRNITRTRSSSPASTSCSSGTRG